MSTTDTGGPAFPRPGFYTDKSELSMDDMREADGFDSAPSVGMTLLDWFAGQVIAGYLAAHAEVGLQFPEPDVAAQHCYDYARALVLERSTTQGARGSTARGPRLASGTTPSFDDESPRG